MTETRSRSISAPVRIVRGCTSSSDPETADIDDLALTSLFINENLCAWTTETTSDDEKARPKGTIKKLESSKPSVLGLQGKRSHIFNGKHFKYKSGKPKDKSDNYWPFIHYTDSRQYVEEYRKNKILRLQKEFAEGTDCENHGRPAINTFEGLSEARKTYPITYLQSYNSLNKHTSCGYRVDSNPSPGKSKCYIQGTSLEKDRELLNKTKVHGKLQDEYPYDTSNTKHGPLQSCKAVSICNLFPYESISLPDNKGHVLKSREPLQPEVSLQCTKIADPERIKSSSSTKSFKGTKSSSDEARKFPKPCLAGKGSNEYCHIIKRVLGQYDHSRYAVRSTQGAETNFNYVLTPS